ncbi:MAG: EAL domain-containing protein [Rhodocyclaceae bacterium]|nr:EAL domain-containing protein [Rhodocyclaceae bacterium]MDZ4213249.1 EAL domain-containing protein [Rhodocyclaceae bacterium]
MLSGVDNGDSLPAETTNVHSEYAEAIELIHRVRNGSCQSDLDLSDRGQVRHWSLPTSKISADFFCSAEHPQNGWFGFLADAAGHGLAAAIFALHTPMLFRESVLLGLSLPAIHKRIDRFLIRQRITGYFVCGILVRVQGREIEVINAGMPDALLLGAGDGLIQSFPSNHLPFGIQQAADVTTSERYRLGRTDSASLLLHSDGLTELSVEAGAPLGAEGVLAMIDGEGDAIFERLVDYVAQTGQSVHNDVSIALIPLPLAGAASAASDASAMDLPDNHAPLPADHLSNMVSALRIVEHFDRGLVLTDASQQILYVNPAFTAITGYSLGEAVGQTPRLLNSGRQNAAFYRDMWQALLSNGEWNGEVWNQRKDGSCYLEWLDIRALRDESGTITHFLGTFTLLVQHGQQEARMHHLALHDSLTGLANRILLADRGEQAMLRADRADRSLAVLFIDLDRFKSINNSLGHDVGDQVLLAVAHRLQGVLRDDDTLSRFGGDEFVCLLPDIAQREDAALVATHLLDALEHPIEVDGHLFKVGASIGISAYPSDGRVLDDLIVLADRAMLRAKQAGGNLYRFFSSEMGIAAERQLEMEARLDAAIRNGELELHYQPKLDLQSREIIGAEALVRWRDPKHGLVPPGAFIPMAEKSDLIAKIGNWVLHEACTALARWEDDLPAHFHVAVNISALQFERCDLAGEVGLALATSGIPPTRLQLEVTESLFIRDATDVASTLDNVLRQGVLIALDDFGTGYSNLGTLIGLPLATFKLDQSFVRDVDSKPANSSVARAVWHLADGLKKHVVAEGIETCGECIEMQALGYRIGQGYRFGKPMAETDFMAHLSRWQPTDCPCPNRSH